MRFFIIILLLLVQLKLQAATITAASASRVDVGTAVASASSGDTVLIPDGNVNWSNQLAYAKSIYLRAEHTGGVWITNYMPDTIGPDGLIDESMISVNMDSSHDAGIFGINFTGRASSPSDFNGTIVISGLSNTNDVRFRFASNRLDTLPGTGVFFHDVLGVVDHNTCTNYFSAIFFYVYHSAWDGLAYSDGSWTNTAGWGTEKFLFFEDNYITYDSDTVYAPWDAYRGERSVIRYNTIVNGWVEMHGTDSGGRLGGARAVEVYENNFVKLGGAAPTYVVNTRSGNLLIHDNRATNYTSAKFEAQAYRCFKDFSPWGSADGTSPWDSNYVGHPFVSGTSTAGGLRSLTDSGKSWTTDQWVGYSMIQTNPFTGTSGSSGSVTVAGAGWSTDQWAGYEIRKTMTGVRSVVSANTATTLTLSGNYAAMDFTGGGNFILSRSSIITANTDTVLTMSGQGGYGSDYTFTSGQGYYLGRIYEALDQMGTYRSTNLVAALPVPPSGWMPHHEATYEWGNTNWVSGTPVNIQITANPFIVDGVHYYSDTTAPGYTAYTYPHPLVGGAGSTQSNYVHFSTLRVGPFSP